MLNNSSSCNSRCNFNNSKCKLNSSKIIIKTNRISLNHSTPSLSETCKINRTPCPARVLVLDKEATNNKCFLRCKLRLMVEPLTSTALVKRVDKLLLCPTWVEIKPLRIYSNSTSSSKATLTWCLEVKLSNKTLASRHLKTQAFLITSNNLHKSSPMKQVTLINLEARVLSASEETRLEILELETCKSNSFSSRCNVNKKPLLLSLEPRWKLSRKLESSPLRIKMTPQHYLNKF